jgi:hypothetical protein
VFAAHDQISGLCESPRCMWRDGHRLTDDGGILRGRAESTVVGQSESRAAGGAVTSRIKKDGLTRQVFGVLVDDGAGSVVQHRRRLRRGIADLRCGKISSSGYLFESGKIG